MNESRSSPDWEALRDLFCLYRAGDPGATSAVFTDITKSLRGFFRVRLSGQPEEAEDLLQVTLLKIHFARDRFDASLSLKTWVFTIANRALIDHWRGFAEERSHRDDAHPDDEGLSVMDLTASEEALPDRRIELTHDLNQALLSLKPFERSIVYLVGVEGLSMNEVATMTDLTESAVKLRAFRAFRDLREKLGTPGVWVVIWLFASLKSGR